jgi:hypothetical protein
VFRKCKKSKIVERHLFGNENKYCTCIHKQNDAIYHILETKTRYFIVTISTILML